MAYVSTTVTKLPCCTTHARLPPAVRPVVRSAWLRRRLPAQKGHCGCTRSDTAAVSTAAAQQSAQPPSAQLARQQPRFTLSRSQLANKQIVTRTDGQILGIVDHLLADPNTCKVVALSCKLTPDMIAGDAPKQVGLMSLKQISDVLLVHDQRALLKQPLTVGLGYVKLVGTAVKTAEGKVLGKVRDFAFSPDDGRIVELVIDALGIPAIPERLLGRLGVRTQLVQNISWSSITLQPGAEAYVNRISRGPFDSFGDLLKGYAQFSVWGNTEAEQSRDDPAYVEWYLQFGEAYEQRNGTKIARPSDIALQSARQARLMQQPQALPPARQPSYDSQLQPQVQPQYQSQLEYQQAEPQLADPYSPQQTQQGWGTRQQPQSYDQQGQPYKDDWSQQASRQQYPQQQPQWQEPEPQRQLPQQQLPMPSAQYQSWPQQQQQQQQQQQAGYTGPAANRQSAASDSYPGTPNKLEQQQRYAARADATITEPRFDPRRRKATGPSTSWQAPGSLNGGNQGYSQPKAAYSAPSSVSYTPQRSDGAQGQSSQRGGDSAAAQPARPLSQSIPSQLSPAQAGTEVAQASRRQNSQLRNGTDRRLPGAATFSEQASQSQNDNPTAQSFQNWTDTSPRPVQPLVLAADGTVTSDLP